MSSLGWTDFAIDKELESESEFGTDADNFAMEESGDECNAYDDSDPTEEDWDKLCRKQGGECNHFLSFQLEHILIVLLSGQWEGQVVKLPSFDLGTHAQILSILRGATANNHAKAITKSQSFLMWMSSYRLQRWPTSIM